MNAITRAADIAGSQHKLAELVGVTQQAISKWSRDGVGPDFVLTVARAVEFGVTPHELRPDLYPHPDDGLPADRRAASVQGAV